ncbi:hypothetical protein B0H13DRAFT_1887201 [Mycena leptocephala]|nr:hypothetical protein B0H13DRAFT_1887201 [Mycena leptocephala]
MDADQPTNLYPLVVGKDFAQFIQSPADMSLAERQKVFQSNWIFLGTLSYRTWIRQSAMIDMQSHMSLVPRHRIGRLDGQCFQNADLSARRRSLRHHSVRFGKIQLFNGSI